MASNLEGAFEQAALALTAIVADPRSVAAKEPVAVSCEAPDAELLLVDWLNALVYEMATRRLLFGRFEVRIDGTRLQATAWGQAMDAETQELTVEPKGATYTALSVRRADGTWVAECVVDV
jgi:SHS2 domain-containing protein